MTVLETNTLKFSKLHHFIFGDLVDIRFYTSTDKLGASFSFSRAGIISLFNNFRFHVVLCHCVSANLKGGGFIWVRVFEHAHACLFVFLCVNGSSVTMYFGEIYLKFYGSPR